MSRKEEMSSLDSGSPGDWRDVTSIRAFASIPFFQDAGEEINNLPERFAELGIVEAPSINGELLSWLWWLPPIGIW